MHCSAVTDKIRDYGKKQACFYCGELSQKIARHYYRKHAGEQEVAVALSFKTGSAERKTRQEKDSLGQIETAG